MQRKVWLVLPVLFMIMALVLAGCGEAELGTEENPIIWSFVPSGEMQDVTAGAEAGTGPSVLLDSYRSQGAGPFSVDAGALLWREAFRPDGVSDPRSCTDCHGSDLKKPGKHVRTGKPISPMDPSVESGRLRDPKKIEKWFKRNCKWTLGRECTPQEKGDFILFIQGLN